MRSHRSQSCCREEVPSLLLRGSVAHPRRVPREEAAHLVRAYALAPGFTAVNDAMRAGQFEGLERIRCPVTLVWPDHDRLVSRPVWVPERISNVALADSGHVPTWDTPEPLARLLISATGGRAPTRCAGPQAVAPDFRVRIAPDRGGPR
ncbi:MAG TPA: alpha/beta hydrolase [Solirubrobacteraceae bacterium]|nr:alpha/beta hydrolase [Solirubrobacteraceae bacterium]